MSKDRRHSPPQRTRWGTVQTSILQAIRDLDAMGRIPYTTAIARHLGMDPSNVNRELRKLLARGRVVRGKRIGGIVPYYLREMIE